MTTDATAEADRRLQGALEASGARDPREFYRAQLRDLRGSNPEAYEKAVEYYRERLIPDVASGSVEPLLAWAEYGRVLAEAVAPGRTVTIDTTGKSAAYEAPAALDRLVLHLPDESGRRALVVSLPPELSDAQRATYDVLVAGKQRLG